MKAKGHIQPQKNLPRKSVVINQPMSTYRRGIDGFIENKKYNDPKPTA
jgi:hypothetical protein